MIVIRQAHLISCEHKIALSCLHFFGVTNMAEYNGRYVVFVHWLHKLLFVVRMSYLRAYTDPSLCLSIISVCQPVLSHELSCCGACLVKKWLCLANHEELQSELNNCLFENPTWEPHELISTAKDFVLGEFGILTPQTKTPDFDISLALFFLQ